jgi:hypothetical protein
LDPEIFFNNYNASTAFSQSCVRHFEETEQKPHRPDFTGGSGGRGGGSNRGHFTVEREGCPCAVKYSLKILLRMIFSRSLFQELSKIRRYRSCISMIATLYPQR